MNKKEINLGAIIDFKIPVKIFMENKTWIYYNKRYDISGNQRKSKRNVFVLR